MYSKTLVIMSLNVTKYSYIAIRKKGLVKFSAATPLNIIRPFMNIYVYQCWKYTGQKLLYF